MTTDQQLIINFIELHLNKSEYDKLKYLVSEKKIDSVIDLLYNLTSPIQIHLTQSDSDTDTVESLDISTKLSI